MDYDKNGNIMALKRKGHTNAAATTFGMMDDLTYNYDAGNKLTKVEDIASLEGFKNGANIATEYTYDQNGNMLTDVNKGITGIVYNHLNLPTQVTMAGQNISYIYDAVGTKLRKTVSGITTDYAGNYVYENSVLQFFNTAEGYVEPKGTGWEYVYQYKDHLGNVRLSYADSNGDGLITATGLGAEIREENNFYPFGLKHKGYNNVVNGRDHKFEFLGQESQNELGLGWITFRHRNADPALGRFFGVDPIAEDYPNQTIYQFASNNPIWKVEIEGLEGSSTTEEDLINGLGYGVDPTGTAPKPEAPGAVRRVFNSIVDGVGSLIGTASSLVHNAVSNIIEGGVRTLIGISEPNTVLTEEEFNNAVVTGDENTFFRGFEAESSAIQNEIPAILGNVGATVVEIAAAEAFIGPKEAPAKSAPKVGPDFVVTPKGVAIPVPNGAIGPTNPKRGSGMLFQGGSGGKGMNDRTTGVRVMDANTNQGSRVNYMNKTGQTVDPATGRTIPNSDKRGHMPIDNTGNK